MKRVPALLLLLLILLLLLAGDLAAQDKPVPLPKPFKPETSAPKASLPGIELPEYVITGRDIIRFTEDRKQSLTLDDAGFSERIGRGNREKRFYDTSPTRMPLALKAPAGSSENLLVQLGYGNFSTPLIEAWYGERLKLGDITAHAKYERSDGWVPLSDYSYFAFDITGGTYLPRDLTPLLSSSRVQDELHIDYHEYGLYANKIVRPTPSPDFRRSRMSLAYAMDLISRRNRVIDHSLKLFIDYNRFSESLSVSDSLTLDEYKHHETIFGLDARAEKIIYDIPLKARLYTAFYNNTETVPGSGSPFYLSVDVSGHYVINEYLLLDASLDYYLFNGNQQALQGRLYPSATLTYLISRDYNLFAAFTPAVEQTSLGGFMRTNNYTMFASELRHRDIPLRFQAGASMDRLKKTSGRVWLEYLASKSFPRYELTPDPVRQQWQLRYNGWAKIFSLNADIKHRFSEDIETLGFLALRSSRNDEIDSRIPYLPVFEFKGVYRHRILEDLTASASLQIVSDRTADMGTLGMFTMLGLAAEYRVTENFGVYVSAENLLDQDYELWQGYQERPLFVQGGITFRY